MIDKQFLSNTDKNINESQIYLDDSELWPHHFFSLLPESVNKLDCLEDLGDSGIQELIPSPQAMGLLSKPVNYTQQIRYQVWGLRSSAVLAPPAPCPSPKLTAFHIVFSPPPSRFSFVLALVSTQVWLAPYAYCPSFATHRVGHLCPHLFHWTGFYHLANE